MMKNRNHNIRFNMEKEDERRAWEILHSAEAGQMSRSQNRFVIEAVNSYYDRCVAVKADPYLETREKEDAFADRIVRLVEGKVLSNLPALFGMYMAQAQPFPFRMPAGGYPAWQGYQGAVPGNVPADTAAPDATQTPSDGETPEKTETDLPDNDLIDFDAF